MRQNASAFLTLDSVLLEVLFLRKKRNICGLLLNWIVGFLFYFHSLIPTYPAGEGVPDWPYYPVLAKFLEGRTEFGDSYDAGSHSYTEPEARPGASHHHPGESCFICCFVVCFFPFFIHGSNVIVFLPSGMFLSMSMEEPNEPLACNVDGGRRGMGGGGGGGSSRSNDDDSSVSMPESGSSAGSEHNDAPPNGHMAGPMGPSDLPHGLGGHHPPLLGPSGMKRRPVSPVDDPRRPAKRPKHGTSTMLLSLMQVRRIFIFNLPKYLILVSFYGVGDAEDRRGAPETAARASGQ